MNVQEFRHIHLDNGKLTNEDIVRLFVPLFSQLTKIYDEDKVANIRNLDNIRIDEDDFEIKINKKHVTAIDNNIGKINELEQGVSFFDITERLVIETNIGDGFRNFTSDDLKKEDEQIKRPVYVLGYRSYEQAFDHYDQKTELFICGLLMASFAFNLDFTNQDDVKTFVENRNNLYQLNKKIHPTLLLIISQLTYLNRNKRTRETRNLVWKLENYKDYSTDYEEDILLSEGYKKQDKSSRNKWVLGKLKSRLFEISRRNKLLYFKNSSKFLNLTIASVPTVLYFEKIKESDLLLWNKEVSKAVKGQGKINLNKYLQFDESGYIKTSLDKIRSDARKDLYEYGFSQLKVVIAFLNWYNFKENKSEKINTPLLIVPTVLTKKKAVNDQYILEFTSNEAEVNPVLRFYLKDLYDIDLPESIDLEQVDIQAFYTTVQRLIESRSHGIELSFHDRPKVRLIQSIAKRKISNYSTRNRYRTTDFNVSAYNYSYSREHFKPLGLEIFKDRIRPSHSYLEFLINDDIKPRPDAFGQEKTRSMYSINKEGEINPYRWEFDVCNITLGNFNYKKMSLVRDYDTLLENADSNQVFTHLFSDEPKVISPKDETICSFEENFYVLNADATQARAISKAKAGKSIIIQGPPGTGKSQTITNLIADFVSNNKRVLFVCEKRAALDVVFARLRSKNLHHLASLVHDSQADKKAFIMDVKASYEKFIAEDDQYIELKTKRASLIQEMKAEIAKIQSYHQLMTSNMKEIGTTLFTFIDQILEYRTLSSSTVDVEQDLDYASWHNAHSVLNDLSRALNGIGLSKEPTQYPLKSLKTEAFGNSLSADSIRQKIENLQVKTEQWLQLARENKLDEFATFKIKQLQNYANLSSLMLRLKSISKTDLLDEFSEDSRVLNLLIDEVLRAEKKWQNVLSTNTNWISKLSESEAKSAYQQLANLEDKFYSFILPKYRNLKQILEQSYNFKAHRIKPSMTSVLKGLLEEYTLKKDLDTLRINSGKKYNTNDLQTLKEEVQQARNQKKSVLKKLKQFDAAQLSILHSIRSELPEIKEDIAALGIRPKQKIVKLQSKLEAMKSKLNTLPVILPYLSAFQQLPDQVIRQINNNKEGLDANEQAIAEHSLKKLYKNDINIVNASGLSLKYSIEKIQKYHKELLDLNGDFLLEQYKSNFKKQYDNSQRYAKEQDKQEKQDKKDFNKSRKILENEFNKKIRYKSIRDLQTIESSYILKLLKPIWLMSPLSVSDTLPIDSELFDVVIFDEASQITLEEGIPTIFRSNQAIVVGDEMQMPPTNFFSSTSQSNEEIEEENNDNQVVIDADSMLTHAVKKLEDVMLSWHYRSQYEGLIGFSNAAFYGGNLFTIPDQETLVIDDEDTDLPLSKRIDQEVISFHYQEDGVYSNRQNHVEAETIAQMVKDLLINKPSMSIGIVAFSMQQQDKIENALTNLARTDQQFGQLLEEAYVKKEDGQHVGLFVKNLENVQGDERDIIIISVCYGFNEKGKMLMNFGPINRKGGEKRLNVIFSRSKKHMAIVSSIHYHNITNEYNEGANFLRRFLQYAESVSKGKEALSDQILASLSKREDSIEREKRSEIVQRVDEYIQSLGYETRNYVGLSRFKLSIAVKSPTNPNAFVLGILLDDDAHYSTTDVIDQYVLRPNLLKTFGWNIIQLYKKDWLEQEDLVKEQIKLQLDQLKKSR